MVSVDAFFDPEPVKASITYNAVGEGIGCRCTHLPVDALFDPEPVKASITNNVVGEGIGCRCTHLPADVSALSS